MVIRAKALGQGKHVRLRTWTKFLMADWDIFFHIKEPLALYEWNDFH